MILRTLSGLFLLALAAPALSAQTAPLPMKTSWSFVPGSEFPGAKGSFSARAADGGEIAFDFAAGGVYVGARGEIALPGGYGELRLRVRSSGKQTVGIRLRDAKGQWHQNDFVYDQPGEWRPLRWDLANFRDKLHWGGPKDGALHYPVREIQILVNKTAASGPSGVLEFSSLQALP